MCATNLWAVNADAWTPEFRQYTKARLGVAPEETDFRIVSRYVRDASPVFTLTSRMCDCGSAIGARAQTPSDDEIALDAWMSWLRDLPNHVPLLTQIAVLRAWSPAAAVKPNTQRQVSSRQLTEQLLLGIRDDALLGIRYKTPSNTVHSPTETLANSPADHQS